MNREKLRRLEAQARLLRKIAPYEEDLEKLKFKIEDIRDRFINPDNYSELLNTEDYELELEELELYINEKIEVVKQRMEDIINEDLNSKIKEEISKRNILLYERNNAEKRLSIWENRKSKTNVVSKGLERKISRIKDEIKNLTIKLENSNQNYQDLSNRLASRPKELEKENELLKRYEALKDSILKRKQRKYKNDVFELLRVKALKLEQIFFMIFNQRKEIIDSRSDLLAELELNEIQLETFEYRTPQSKFENEESILPEEVSVKKVLISDDEEVSKSKKILDDFIANAQAKGYLSSESTKKAEELYYKFDQNIEKKEEDFSSIAKKWLAIFKIRLLSVNYIEKEEVRKLIDELRNFEASMYREGYYLQEFEEEINEIRNTLNSKLTIQNSSSIQKKDSEEKMFEDEEKFRNSKTNDLLRNNSEPKIVHKAYNVMQDVYSTPQVDGFYEKLRRR